MGLFDIFRKKTLPDNGGFRRVTIYRRDKPGWVVKAPPMSANGIARMADKISETDEIFGTGLRQYIRNYRVVAKVKADMPLLTTQQEFKEYMAKEFPGRTKAAVFPSPMSIFLIVGEIGEPDKDMLL